MRPIEINKKPFGKYAIAPYNFVSLPDESVVKYKSFEALPSHGSFKNRNGKALLRGYIDYAIRAETPIIVSQGNAMDRNTKFFQDLNGEYAIPASTIRGLVRTNSQILSFSNIVDEIEDSRFLYRDIAGNNALSIQYRKVLGIKGMDAIARNLKVGYLKKEGARYYIYPSIETGMDRPYFKINEIKLRKIAKNHKENHFMYRKSLLDKEEDIKNAKNSAERNRVLSSVTNRDFKPYQVEVSFNDDSKKKIRDLGSPGQYAKKGYLLSSNYMWGKMAHYIIPEEDRKRARMEISEDVIEDYLDDMILTKKAENVDGRVIIKRGSEFYDLPKGDEVKPVFYIQLENELHFGFTPYLRLRYGKSVLDGLSTTYLDEKGISYTEGLFGFINKILDKDQGEKADYKSRLSFEDAKILGNGVIDGESCIDILLAEPKPTSYNLYLKQDLNRDKRRLDIYEDDFKIRGFKQYWLKGYIEKESLDRRNKNMTQKIYPLKEGTRFQARVHFENLEEDELGLLIWSLKLEENSYQNIGLGKPLGFGRVKIEDIQLKIENLEEKYNSFAFDFHRVEDPDRFIDIYKKKFSKEYLQGEDIEKTKTIREFFKIKSKLVKKEEGNYYRYMDLQNKDFRDKKVLPEILEYENALNIL